MRFPALLIAASLVMAIPGFAGEHGGEDSNWTGGDAGPAEFGFDPSMMAPNDAGEVPVVPSDVRNWFEDYALQKSLQEKQNSNGRMDEAEIQNALAPMMIVQKKTVKTSSPSGASISSKTSTSTTPNSATASVTQTISPNIFVSVPPSSLGDVANAKPEEKQDSEPNTSEAERRIQAYNKKVWDKNFGAGGKTSAGGSNGSSGGLAASWKSFFSRWFAPGASGGRSALARRFDRPSDDDSPSAAQVMETDGEGEPLREISAASNNEGLVLDSLTSSGSWFGWVGWLVAFGLLASMVNQLRSRSKH